MSTPTMKPYADDAASMTIGDLTLENGRDCVAVGGSLDLTRDKAGLAHARALRPRFRSHGAGRRLRFG